MDLLRAMLNGFMSAILTPFAGRSPLLGLCVFGVALGVFVLCVFRRTTNPKKIQDAKRKLQARIYELRLFSDEPALVWRAQLGLLASNARYLGLMLIPAIVMAIPMALVFAPFDSFYGRTPLPIGQQALVTVQMNSADAIQAVNLSTPAAISIESPAVRVPSARQVSWRIRALAPVSGLIRVTSPDGVVEKTIQAGAGPQLLSERRVSSPLDLLEHPEEPQITARSVNWIEIQYPRTEVHAAGIDLPWWAWLLIVSMATALVLKRRFHVSF